MHMGWLGEENRCTWGVWAKKSMHMNLQDEKIDAHEPSGRKNRCTLGYLDGKINAQVWNLCIDFSEHTTTCALILDNIEFSVEDVLASRKV